MSEIALFENSLPSYLKTVELDDDTKSMLGSSGHRISTSNGAFSMVVGGKVIATREERYINVVIVRMAKNDWRNFYEGEYKEGESKPPVCWSSDNVRPDSGATKPQANTCEDCPNNIKGSARQGEGKACRTSRRLAVVLENDLEGNVYEFNVPGRSTYGDGEQNKWPLRPYVQYLGNNGVPIGAAVTEIKFDLTDKGRINFRPVKALSEGQYNIIRSRAEDPAALNALKLSYSQPKADTPKALAKPAAPVVEEAEDEVEDAVEAAPVVKKVKEAEKPVAASDKDAKLKALLDELDDDEDAE